MNRGHALSLRDAGPEALVAYAHAIALLHSLPVAEHPAWANSLGAALMNYGQLLHRVHGVARADEALNAFAEAIAVLAAISPLDVPWARRNLAGTLLNRANLLLDWAQPRSGGTPAAGYCDGGRNAAAPDARVALSLVAVTEYDDVIDAELALKARRALCDALGHLVAGANAAGQDVIADEASEVLDDALAVIREWTARGATAFAPLAIRFFRFGVELYRRHQPHFLVEFIEENLDVAPAHADELRVIAHLGLDGALADGATPARHALGDPATERALCTRRDLAAARARLDVSSFVA